jgi:hypothetical protein
LFLGFFAGGEGSVLTGSVLTEDTAPEQSYAESIVVDVSHSETPMLIVCLKQSQGFAWNTGEPSSSSSSSSLHAQRAVCISTWNQIPTYAGWN